MERRLTLSLPQRGETAVRLERNGTFAWRYAYGRAAETRVAGDAGQDYLALSADDQSVAFALCDGVSQSFYGDLAARLLGDALVRWLSVDAPASMSVEVVQASLIRLLDGLTVSIGDAIRGQELPSGCPAMLRDVLEQKRRYGSESTFIGGRLDRPGALFPQGRFLLTWMGDSRIRLWGTSGDRTSQLRGAFSAEQRWSSRRGLVGGMPQLAVGPLSDDQGTLIRVVAYSDGLAALDQQSRLPSNAALQEIISQASNTPASDDVCYLELWVGDASDQVLTPALPQSRRRHASASYVAPAVNATRSVPPGASASVMTADAPLVLTAPAHSTPITSPPWLRPRAVYLSGFLPALLGAFAAAVLAGMLLTRTGTRTSMTVGKGASLPVARSRGSAQTAVRLPAADAPTAPADRTLTPSWAVGQGRVDGRVTATAQSVSIRGDAPTVFALTTTEDGETLSAKHAGSGSALATVRLGSGTDVVLKYGSGGTPAAPVTQEPTPRGTPVAASAVPFLTATPYGGFLAPTETPLQVGSLIGDAAIPASTATPFGVERLVISAMNEPGKSGNSAGPSRTAVASTRSPDLRSTPTATASPARQFATSATSSASSTVSTTGVTASSAATSASASTSMTASTSTTSSASSTVRSVSSGPTTVMSSASSSTSTLSSRP